MRTLPKFKTVSIILLLMVLTLDLLWAQERLKPGRLYTSGEKLFAPRIGLRSIVPEGWTGVIPQGTEVFSLMNSGQSQGQVFIFALEDSRENILERWKKGVPFENNILLVLDGEPFKRGESTAGHFKILNSTNTRSVYAEIKCSEYGFCVQSILLTVPEYLENDKLAVIQFNDHTVFEEPSMKSIYDQFNWNEFLSDKYLATYISNPYVKKRNEIWLCANGNFRSRIKNKNIGNVPPEYLGSNKGTWEIQGKGPQVDLILNFEKSEPVTIKLTIEEEKIYINGERYYVMIYDECK